MLCAAASLKITLVPCKTVFMVYGFYISECIPFLCQSYQAHIYLLPFCLLPL